MSRIRTLDLDALSDRLDELLALKLRMADARAVVNGRTADDEEAAQTELEDAIAAFGEDEAAELTKLEALRDEIGSRGTRIHSDGGPFVHEGDFEEYAREVAEDIHGAAVRDAEWPFTRIDWSAAADDLRMDYSSVEYDGDRYLYRS